MNFNSAYILGLVLFLALTVYNLRKTFKVEVDSYLIFKGASSISMSIGFALLIFEYDFIGIVFLLLGLVNIFISLGLRLIKR